MNMEKICRAINGKKCLKISYKGGTRVIEPYVCGYARNGSLKLRAYQVEGFSSSGYAEGWKLFNVDDIENIEILKETFDVRSDYNPYEDKHIPEIICKV